MRTTQQLSITLPIEMAQMVNAKVESGDYASTSEVVRAGLRALAQQDSAFDAWLRDEIPRRLAAHDADPASARTADEVRATLAGIAARRR